MQPIEIFKVGTHTAMNGVKMPFSKELLSAAVSGYDAKTHEAPVVVGHPKDNHPAFGWIDHLELTDDGVVLAHPKQIDANFAELVKDGKYKKVSASWYLPDSPANPKPGTLYLRHVGFLGAMPPAIKGLGDVQFSEGEQGVVEFGDTSPWIWSSLASTFRSIREWVIGKDGIEVADKMMPSYIIDDLNAEAERQRQDRMKESMALPNFSEGTQPMATPNPTPPNKTPEQQTADFAERERTIAERERALAKREIVTQIDGLIAEGKVLPAQKAGLVEFMASLDDTAQTVEFGEGAQAKKQSPRQFMADYLGALPKVVDFQEHSKPNGAQGIEGLGAEELAKRAADYHAKQAKAGNDISFSEAMSVVVAGKDGSN